MAASKGETASGVSGTGSVKSHSLGEGGGKVG